MGSSRRGGGIQEDNESGKGSWGKDSSGRGRGRTWVGPALGGVGGVRVGGVGGVRVGSGPGRGRGETGESAWRA